MQCQVCSLRESSLMSQFSPGKTEEAGVWKGFLDRVGCGVGQNEPLGAMGRQGEARGSCGFYELKLPRIVIIQRELSKQRRQEGTEHSLLEAREAARALR